MRKVKQERKTGSAAGLGDDCNFKYNVPGRTSLRGNNGVKAIRGEGGWKTLLISLQYPFSIVSFTYKTIPTYPVLSGPMIAHYFPNLPCI